MGMQLRTKGANWHTLADWRERADRRTLSIGRWRGRWIGGAPCKAAIEDYKTVDRLVVLAILLSSIVNALNGK